MRAPVGAHSVLARALQNVLEFNLVLGLRPATPVDYLFVLSSSHVRGAIIGECPLHWSAIVKHRARLWYVDSRASSPVLLTSVGFACLLRTHGSRAFYVLST